MGRIDDIFNQAKEQLNQENRSPQQDEVDGSVSRLQRIKAEATTDPTPKAEIQPPRRDGVTPMGKTWTRPESPLNPEEKKFFDSLNTGGTSAPGRV